MDGHGRSWKVMEGHGRSWKVLTACAGQGAVGASARRALAGDAGLQEVAGPQGVAGPPGCKAAGGCWAAGLQDRRAYLEEELGAARLERRATPALPRGARAVGAYAGEGRRRRRVGDCGTAAEGRMRAGHK